MSGKKQPLSFKLPESLAQKLDDEAERRQISKSELVREAVAEYIVEPRAAEPGSFLAAAEDLAGCLEADPGQSTSDLEGYGS